MNLTVKVKTEKVVAHQENGMPKIETITQSISPEATFKKFLQFLPNQNYKSATVVKVFEDGEEVNKVDEYQSKVDAALETKHQFGEKVDYKSKSEKLEAKLSEVLERLEALESNKGSNNLDRGALESKATELNITFRSNIGDDKLLAKIKEIEPNFELN